MQSQTECNSVVIGELPSSMTEFFLRQNFERFGDIDAVLMLEGRHAEITFYSCEKARKCYDYYHKQSIPVLGNKSIKIKLTRGIGGRGRGNGNRGNGNRGNGNRGNYGRYHRGNQRGNKTKSLNNKSKSKITKKSMKTTIIYMNECSKEEMKQINGIGQVIANRIDEAREQKPFSSIDDMIKRVKGLGKKKMKQIQKIKEISFGLLALGFCRETAEKLKMEIIPKDIINIIRLHCYSVKYISSAHNKQQNDGKSKQSAKKYARKRSNDTPCIIRSGVNCGLPYYPNTYKSNKRWRRLK